MSESPIFPVTHMHACRVNPAPSHRRRPPPYPHPPCTCQCFPHVFQVPITLWIPNCDPVINCTLTTVKSKMNQTDLKMRGEKNLNILIKRFLTNGNDFTDVWCVYWPFSEVFNLKQLVLLEVFWIAATDGQKETSFILSFKIHLHNIVR